MRAIFDRLEPNTTDETLIEGLQARVADPMWMLARQWQSGEFDGEDAATPIRAEITTETLPLTTLTGPDGKSYDMRKSALPLETRVEAIAPSGFSAEDLAGQIARGWDMLTQAGIDTPALRDRIRSTYPVKPKTFHPNHPIPAPSTRRLRVLARHGFDPAAMIADQGQALGGGGLNGSAAQKLFNWMKAVADAAALYGHSAEADAIEAWQGHELGYSATVSTRVGEEQIDLNLKDYGGGRLDWYSFDRDAPDMTKKALPAKLQRENRTTIPLPLTYAGQPVQRFWEFEDGAVQFGAISAGPGDLARILVADFAAMGGDDMFVIPISAPVGSLVRVASLKFTDGFGRSFRLSPARTQDRQASKKGDLPFDLFALGGPEGEGKYVSDWLPILPVTANAMNGKPLEKITLRRDEDANLAWAVEEEVEGVFGKSIRRRSAWNIEESDDPSREDDDPEVWPYKLQTAVPPWWIPLVPERIGRSAATQLRRARLGIWETLDTDVAGPRSRLMASDRAVTMAEHTVPKSGVRISRHWQVARSHDGKPILWQSWRRQTGADDRLSGLQFDMIDRKW